MLVANKRVVHTYNYSQTSKKGDMKHGKSHQSIK